MRVSKKPNLEPIPGYRLIEPLGSGGFGEVWKCEAPGGLVKAIKFVGGNSDHLIEGCQQSRNEHRAIQRIKDIRHPFLLSMERVELVENDLVIVMELADKSLDDLLAECRKAGRPGLPRPDLLRYLREAAEVLDLMNLEYGLQHLDVKPRNLFLVRDHIKVADFGLVQSLGERGDGQRMALSTVTPLYAAPELFRGTLSRHSDQYSLAIVFQELLTGTVPFPGTNVRQLMFQHTTEKPALEALPPADRAAIARALAKDPEERFPTCGDLVRALSAPTESPASRVVRARPSAQGRLRVGAGDTRSTVASTVQLGPAEGKALPDYSFLTCLSRDPLAETWEAQTAEGKRRLVKFLYAAGGASRQREQEAVLHLQALRHPALLPLSMVPGSPGCLVLVSDLVETSLRTRFQEWQARGERGIPPSELLAHLQAAAEALDQLYQQHGLQHLDLNPSRLLLEGRRVLLGDFGLAQLLWLPAGVKVSQAQMRYTAPELCQQLITRSCDQYSLAIIYQEMLSGHHPFRGRMAGARSATRVTKVTPAALRRGRPEGPNLEAVPPAERPVLIRALDPDPEKRFGSCVEFVRALRAAGAEGLADTIRLATSTPLAVPTTPRDLIAKLFHEAREMCSQETEHPERPAVEGESAEGRFVAILPPSNALRKFDGFRQQWGAKLIEEGETSALFRIEKKGRFGWLRWARSAAVLIHVRWARPHGLTNKMPEVVVCVRPAPQTGSAGYALFRDIARPVLESLQTSLLGNPERRSGERVPWPHPVTLSFASASRGKSESLICQGKDLSLAGIGLYLPGTLPTSQVRLSLTSSARPEPCTVSGNVVRIQRWDDNLFEAGILFE
jgi:serine/threonine protein kinase